MKLNPFFILASLLISTNAFAELPPSTQNAKGEITSAKQLSISVSGQTQLKQQLSSSVFRLYAKQPNMHSLIKDGALFDGAAVAVSPEAVKDIITNKDEIVEEPAQPETKKQNHSMFNSSMARASSHFNKGKKSTSTWSSQRQFYLTTADWLTNHNALEIEIFGQNVKARLDYRDDAQNVAVISTPQNDKITPVDVYEAEKPVPGVVFILLNPNSIYESLTQHALNVTQDHLYGTTTVTARNGYPLFTASGELAGLVVGPDNTRTNAFVVHPKVLDRALHPKKYDRTTVEEIKLEEY